MKKNWKFDLDHLDPIENMLIAIVKDVEPLAREFEKALEKAMNDYLASEDGKEAFAGICGEDECDGCAVEFRFAPEPDENEPGRVKITSYVARERRE